MLVIPAMDIRCGKFVHLLSLHAWEELIDNYDPIDVARWWKEQGASMLHITDLDGSFRGQPESLEVIKEIVNFVKMPLQVSGGIRTLKHIEDVLEAGASRVVLSAIAAREPKLIGQACKEFGDQVAVGIEGRNNMVAVEGWNQPTDWSINQTAQSLRELGVERVVFNDTRRDGSLKGPNLQVAKELAEKTGLKVIISGGVSSLEDLKQIAELASVGIEGVIVGKALYTGAIKLKDAMKIK
ncbi:MAG: 1-(5-phosphoribosyl)-5-[(5-phosphoribosylamino)methylideneamino] imidazole-4-carboxamide isomerase [Clostridiaceae bacterium BRH_c20a]|nr:MAG: 1-(5-phosphoribosyl)-5-[(5-phosphoribosylamino)methylideneamino] imidazole-4-carboxamide isomerase [Clostridiaceae bacterium BRH_c20a]